MKKILKAFIIVLLCFTLTMALASCGLINGGANAGDNGDSGDNGNGGNDSGSNEGGADQRLNPCAKCEEGEYVASVVTKATTFEKGQTKYTCDKCSDNYLVDVPATGEMKILLIGDASTSSLTATLSKMLGNAGITKVVIGTLNCNFNTGAHLDTQYNNITKGTSSYTFTMFTNGEQANSEYSKTFDYGLDAENWDKIVIQQSVVNAGLESSYSKLNDITTHIKEKAADAEILWNMTWALHDESTNSNFSKYNSDQDAMFAGIISSLQSKVMTNSSIDAIIPTGTAIQNLRSTFLDGQVTGKEIKLDTEIGDYAAALTWCSVILDTSPDEIVYELTDELQKRERLVMESVTNALDSALEIKAPVVKTFKLLAFGNSYSNDALTYLHHIFASAGYDEIIIGSVSDGGCNLAHHWSNIDDTLEDYHPAAQYDGMTGVEGTAGCSIRVNGITSNVKGDTLKERYINTIKAYDWDFVTIQHAPNEVERSDTYSDLPRFLEFIKEHLTSEDTKFIFHMIWKYNDNQTQYNQTQYHYNTILDIAQNIVMINEEFEGLIPAVTMRQNLVSSYLQDVDISRDYGHMGLTLGRYALGLLWYCYLTGGSVDDVTFIPTEENVSKTEMDKYRLEYGHNHIKITESDMLVIKEAINNALENPFKVTQSIYTTAPAK